ncbi:MAG: hypothetical protein IH823_09380 [Candidatus Dadabacteria bacterium]|nr:hypothetical protein [Candidatus Dadabacteria bacterium]
MIFQDVVRSNDENGISWSVIKNVVIIDSKKDAGWIAFTPEQNVPGELIMEYQRMEVKSLFNDAFLLMVDNQRK